ncbi:MAG: chromosome-partitioning protein ParB [Pseudomonadota bacterium]
MSEKKHRGLGRGLSALMADVRADVAAPGDDTPRRADLRLPIERIHPNPDQPRRDFPAEALNELASSIRAKGIIQPLVVRVHPTKSEAYEIVAGERRWRAAQLAQVHDLPVVVRDFSDTEVLEVAIIENIQRADLNPVEEAAGYRQLMDRFGHTQEKLAEALGKSRSHVANLLRLLHLPDQVLDWLREGKLSSGHARALVTTEDPVGLAREVISRGLSVRETEKLAQQQATRGANRGPARPRPSEKDADTRALEADLSAILKMRVAIDHKGHDGGQVVITYRTLDQLDDLCQRLSASH